MGIIYFKYLLQNTKHKISFVSISKFVLVLMFLLIINKGAFAQYTNTHYIAPSPWSYFNRYNELVITTLSTSPVTVSITSSNGTVFSNTLTTVAGNPLRYRFTALHASQNNSLTTLSGAGLIVSALSPIGVQIRNIASDNYTISGQTSPGDLDACVQKGNTAFTSFGDQGLGTSFRVGYYSTNNGGGCYSETGAPIYSVMAIQNSTTVQLNGTNLVTLNAGQSYLFQATMGSLVSANNNIVVNSGMRVDNSSGCGDGVLSQVIPISNLGTSYVIVRTDGDPGYEQSTIIATQANTVVTVAVTGGSSTNYTLTNAGSYITINNGNGSTLYSTSYVTSTKPVAVYTGSADGCEIDMIVQPAISGCSGSFDVQTNSFLNNVNGSNAQFPYFGYVLIKSLSEKVFFNGIDLETISGVTARVAIGSSGFFIIRFTNTNLSNPNNLRFTSAARISVSMIQSGAGYSMSSFISSISAAFPPPSVSSTCIPATITAQAGFTSYKWYRNGTLISGASSNVYVASTIGSYTVVGVNASCGDSDPSTPIVINQSSTSTTNTTICSNQLPFLWNGVNRTTAGTYTFTTTNSGGCDSVATLILTVNQSPTVAALTGTNTACIGSTTTFASSTSGGVWSTATPSVASVSNGIVSGLTAGTSIISYAVTSGNGCSTSVNRTVTINALPTVAAITGTQTVCVGATRTFANTTSGGVWSSSNTAVATITSGGIITGVSAGIATISYTVTNVNGCVTAVTRTITVNALPTVNAISGSNSTCMGTNIILSSTTSGGVWSSGSTNNATISSGGIVTPVSAGSSLISYTITDANICSNVATTNITINALPTVSALTGTNSICIAATTTYTTSTTGGVWSSANNSIATVNSSGLVTGVAAGTVAINYTVTNANNCSTIVSRNVTVNAGPNVNAITGTLLTTIGSTTTLANTTGSGTWSSGNTAIGTVNSSGVVTGVTAGDVIISYSRTGSGCTTTVSSTVTINPRPNP